MKQTASTVCIIFALSIAGCDTRSGRVGLLVGDDSLEGYFSVAKESVAMYASPEEKKAGKSECRIYEDEYDVFVKMFRVLTEREVRAAYLAKGDARFDPGFADRVRSLDGPRFRFDAGRAKPLEGLRVAIDPGHSAGSMDEAIREGKYMSLPAPGGRLVRFHESALNLATAKALREMLREGGATVMLTREDNRQVYPVPFKIWERNNFRQAVRDRLRERQITGGEAAYLLKSAGEKRRLKFFNSEYEMPRRAELINAFRPHITILAHFNAYDDDTGYRSKYLRIKNIMAGQEACDRRLKEIDEVIGSIAEVRKNFCSAYVPGCFLPGELDSVESRIEFLRLVISPDLENSARYSKYVVDNFRDYLGVPVAQESYYGAHRAGICRKGVYARNFRMTRLVRGVLCLGEPVLQNNMEEAVRLEGIAEGKVPERVRSVARAYYDAVITYAGKHMAE